MHKFPIRIYYEDTDFSGFVYHARYLHFFERARTEALRALGVDQRALFATKEGSLSFVVRAMKIDFKRPAWMDDLVEVSTCITSLGAASLVMDQKLHRAQKWHQADESLAEVELLTEAEVKIAFLQNGKPQKFSPSLREKLIKLTKKENE